jgi:hypothetical protein
VNEAYIAYLTKLNEKMEYAASADHSQVVAFKEMAPHLESLRVKVAISLFSLQPTNDTDRVIDGLAFFSFSSPASRPWPRYATSCCSESTHCANQTR